MDADNTICTYLTIQRSEYLKPKMVKLEYYEGINLIGMITERNDNQREFKAFSCRRTGSAVIIPLRVTVWPQRFM